MTPGALEQIRQALFYQCILAVMLGALLWSLGRRQPGESFYRCWMAAWFAYALFELTSAVSLLPALAGTPQLKAGLRLVGSLAATVHPVCLVAGALAMADVPEARVRQFRSVALAAGLAATLAVVLHSFTLADAMAASQLRSMLRLLLTTAAFSVCAALFWRVRRRLGAGAAVSLVVILSLWALEQSVFVLSSVRTVGLASGWPVAWLPDLAGGLGLQVALLDFIWLAGVAIGLNSIVLARSDRDRGELARATRAYRTLIESSPSAIVVVDRASRVQLVNDAARRLFGWPDDVRAIVPPEPQPAVEGGSPWAAALQGASLTGVIGEVPGARGDARVVSLAVAPLEGADGAVDGAIGVATDLTGQRRLEAELRHAQKMEAVGRLAGGIAHDFNNLLTAIIGSVHLLRDELPADHPAQEAADEISDAADRAADLTRRLLGFSRRERRAPVPLDLDAVVLDYQKLLRRMMDENVILHVELAGGLPPVIADRGELEQVITNLCINARDAMQQAGGSITLRTTALQVPFPLTGLLEAAPAGRFVRLDVSDTGTGMDAQTVARMFEPFYTTKQLGQGTGLGLATVYAIIEELGGQLRVDSTPGIGTVFSLFLRAA